MTIDFKQFLPQLKELQEMDRRLLQIEFESKAIPEQLETSGSEYLALSRELQDKESASQAMTKERLKLEEDLKILSVQIQEKEKRLYAIKTQKEYQATLKEIAQIKKENKDREERILTLLEGFEKISQEVTQLKSGIADKEGGYRQIEGDLKKSQQDLEVEKERVIQRRPELLKELPPEVLKKYDTVKKRYSDAVASVVKGICQGCNMNIPPQVYNEMLKMKDLRNCPSCHRLIYVEVE